MLIVNGLTVVNGIALRDEFPEFPNDSFSIINFQSHWKLSIEDWSMAIAGTIARPSGPGSFGLNGTTRVP
jgi:hypothetical protein